MFDQLDSFIIRYDELSELLSDPEVIGDTKRFMELTKEEANLRPKVETFKRYQQVVEEISDTEEMLGESLDAEMAEMAKEELASLKKEKVELEEKIKKVGKGYLLQRYKGLGEMNADQLWETTMNPESRTLIRVVIDDKAQAERRVSTLMGNKVEPRRKWIESHVEFS